MMEETKKSKSLRLLTVLLSVAAVAAMLWCAPYFKDDWAWGSQVGLDRLQSHFTGYNGWASHPTAGIWAICWSWSSPAPCR